MHYTDDTPVITDDMTIAQAREIMEGARLSGVTCPCCDQFAKLYQRKLNTGMAASLLWLVSEYLKTLNWVDMAQAPKRIIQNREIGKLQHWGLVVNHKNKWQPTQAGIKFAMGEVDVPQYAFIYNNKLVGLSKLEKVNIKQALADKFDYEQLTRDIPSSHAIATSIQPETLLAKTA